MIEDLRVIYSNNLFCGYALWANCQSCVSSGDLRLSLGRCLNKHEMNIDYYWR